MEAPKDVAEYLRELVAYDYNMGNSLMRVKQNRANYLHDDKMLEDFNRTHRELREWVEELCMENIIGYKWVVDKTITHKTDNVENGKYRKVRHVILSCGHSKSCQEFKRIPNKTHCEECGDETF